MIASGQSKENFRYSFGCPDLTNFIIIIIVDRIYKQKLTISDKQDSVSTNGRRRTPITSLRAQRPPCGEEEEAWLFFVGWKSQ